MKLSSLLISSILVATCCVQAKEAAKPHELEYRDTEKFTKLIGLEIRNLQDEKLGKVKFITVDLENARLVEIVVTTTGGVWGLGTKITAVPPRACILDEEKNVMRIDTTKAKFNGAPTFDAKDIAASSQQKEVEEVNRYYGLQPWFFTKGQTVKKNEKILRLGYVQRTDKLLGLPIVNTKGAFVGHIETITMDLPKGEVVHIVAVTADKTSPRSSVQARALKFNSARDGLILDDNMAELAGEPHFKWTNDKKKSFKQEAYVNREVEADNGHHSKQNAKEGIVSKSTSIEKGQNYRDEEKTRTILALIQAEPKLSATAKDIEVVTLNGQTTLRGHVDRTADKKKIGEIAMKAGQPENVSNLLEVRKVTESVSR